MPARHQERDQRSSPDQARSELGGLRSRPPWLNADHALPFRSLSPDEFEILSFLLLSSEHGGTGRKVSYYGKTGDLGRDITVIAPGELELTQCKHYSDNVGVGVVRVELAKLFTNVCAGAIPKPDTVVFFVSSDLTAKALDLLHDQNEWVRSAPEILREYLGDQPSGDLLKLAGEWWPTLRHINGLELTQRLQKYPALVEEFFSQRSVITGDVAEVLEGQERLGETLDLLMAVSQQSATEALARILERAGQQSPGLAFAAEVTAGGETTYKVTVQQGAGPVPIGTLRFAGAPNGMVGAAKFRKCIEEGRPADLGPGEFEWIPKYRFPGRGEGKTETTRLTISPNLPNVRAPVRIQCERQGGTPAVVDLCYMRLVRAGTRELELELTGGQLAAAISLTLRHDGGPPAISLALDLGSVPPGRALKTIRVFELLQLGADSLCITSLEFDLPLIELHGLSGFSFGSLEDIRNLLVDLDTIAKWCSVDIRFPDGLVDADQAHQVRLLAAGIRKGRVGVRPPNDVFSVEMTDTVASDLARNLKPGQPSLTFGPDDVTFDLFGKSVGPIRVLVHVLDPEFALPPQTAAQGAGATPGQTCVIGLRCSKVVYEFPEWVAAEPTGATPPSR